MIVVNTALDLNQDFDQETVTIRLIPKSDTLHSILTFTQARNKSSKYLPSFSALIIYGVL
jgi:hypothetical protein